MARPRRLGDGPTLVACGCRHEPLGQRACDPADGGQIWDCRSEIVLGVPGPGGPLHPGHYRLP